ncbi:DUF6580 family putative transport protein [Rhizosphaericola mali]|uniref:Uncharacterized protein n=1 Tax=Rhizosphaericola mali TaxID=2545455 RepID=A0A5P2GAZ6_9BACT|nr:DUF6580 family putative transport protein [Rhizosphaericola mali]QES90860.1 hypothetical protein E0W69_020150 [Rhizosphaericola mali]
MKKGSSIIIAFVLLTVVGALYRIVPGRPFGFAPQYAMALFGGFLFQNDKKWAFILPIGSMFLSDLLFQGLFKLNMTSTPGFYSGQLVNYILFAILAVFGFIIKKMDFRNIIMASVLSTTFYFLVSNMYVWISTDFYSKNWGGLMQSYTLGLPFYRNSIIATLVFSAILFGGYALIGKSFTKSQRVTA